MNFYKFAMPIYGAIALTISGCNSENTSEAPPQDEGNFKAIALSSEGGIISPSEQMIASGQQGHFSLEPNEGFTIEGASGCGGHLDGNKFTTAPMYSDCKISASFKPDTPDVYYNATTESAGGGHLNPSSLQIKSGKSGEFQVIPDSGFTLNKIEGCDGSLIGKKYKTGKMISDCQISADFISNAVNAIINENHNLANDQELIAHARGAISDSEDKRIDITTQIFQGIEEAEWYPSHDSATFSSYKPEMTMSLISASDSNKGKEIVPGLGLVMVSEDDGYRRAVTSGNLFAESNTQITDKELKNLIHWLTKGSDSDSIKVVTAHIPEQSYAYHNSGIRTWFTNNYTRKHEINSPDSCDYENLSNCIKDFMPELIILSENDGDGRGYQSISSSIALARENGIPLLIVNYNRGETDFISPQYREMGLVATSNYYSDYYAENIAVPDLLEADPQLKTVDTLLRNLSEGNFDPSSLTLCNGNFLYCDHSEKFNEDFKFGADWLRVAASTYDMEGETPFSNGNIGIVPAALLLADKYRGSIDYPIQKSNAVAWQQAMFSDWVVSYAREKNLAQPDLGEFVVDKKYVVNNENSHYKYPVTISEQKMFHIDGDVDSGKWTATGWYSLPGQKITLTRKDNDPNTSVRVKLNYHRPNTNRAYGVGQPYMAPLELATERLPLMANNSITFSSPYGGPIYFSIDGPSEVNINANGVAHHPTIMDFNSEQQISDFESTISTSEIPHVDLNAEVAQQHLRRDRFLGAITGAILDTKSLLASIVNDHVNNVYTLAGFKTQGKTLDESLPDEVKSICVDLFGNDCLNEDIHNRKNIQHENYDQNAQCGAGCAGNPWDSSGNIDPTGWLDNHELGHNLQTNKLNVHYVASTGRNLWNEYQNRAGENSNNIFPYFVLWRTHYIRDQLQNTIYDGHMNSKDLFFGFMSDAAKVTNSIGERVVLDPACAIINGGQDRFDAMWSSPGYAENNSFRMTFYIQMALKAHNMTAANGSSVGNGFNIFTLLYLHSRLFSQAATSQSAWDEKKSQLGFGLFPYDGNVTYSGGNVNNIPGNDFMLVSLSKLTGRDWRSHFDLLGLRYSDLAVAQVLENTLSNMQPMQMGMYVLDDNLPPLNMSQDLDFLTLSLDDGSTVWPGKNSSTSPNTPASCTVE